MDNLAIIGLGLIGTSIGLALKKAGVDVEIVGHDKHPDPSSMSYRMGAVDKTEWNLKTSDHHQKIYNLLDR